MDYWLGVIGTWIVADGVASLWTYTRADRKSNQDWLRDHSFRLLRILLGVVIVAMGVT